MMEGMKSLSSCLVLLVCFSFILVQCQDCEYNGQNYNDGDSFDATDGCNTCTCSTDGSVSCTEIGCIDTVCIYMGQSYTSGARFAAADGCNSCGCEADGSVGCTEIGCRPCTNSDGSITPAGQYGPAQDGCGECVCSNGWYDCPILHIFECHSGSGRGLPQSVLFLLSLCLVTLLLTRY